MSIPHTYRDSHGTYYVRYVIPSRLRPHLLGTRRDIRKSLKTKDSRQARLVSRRYLVEIDRLLGEYEMRGYRDKEYYLDLINSYDPLSDLARTEQTGVQKPEHRIELITSIDPHGNEVRIERDDPMEEVQIYKALQSAWGVNSDAVQRADYMRAYPECQQGSQSIDEMIDVFFRDKKGGLKENSLKELISSLELFRKFVGDRPIKNLTKGDIRDYRESVPKVPSRYYQTKGLAEMSFDELIQWSEERNLKRISARTVGKKIEAARQLLQWAHESADFLREDLSGPLKRKYIDTANNVQPGTFLAFTEQHLKNLIGSYLYRGALPGRLHKVTPYKFWLPLIAMYTGARLEEICQLYLQDIQIEHGVHFFRISADDEEGVGKEVNIKTASSHRDVPIHSELVRIGLLDYVEELKTAKETRLFPDLDKDNPKKRYGYAVTKWFGDTLRLIIKYEKGQGYGFHSFRKLFTQRLQNVTDVPREIRMALVGHSIGGGDTHEIYEGKYDVDLLKRNIERLEYPELDMTEVSWIDFKQRVSEWDMKRRN